MNVAFILSMPGNNSWNGKWTGDESVYAVIRNIRDVNAASILGSHSYNFGDGWRAAVDVRTVNALEARRLRKASKGFCSYEWMIDSIVLDGAIYGPTQPKPNQKEQEVTA